jgi:two-component system OmpR family response regulator
VDTKAVYAVTNKGDAELTDSRTSLSPAELKMLVLIDGKRSVAQLMQGAPALTEQAVDEALRKLIRLGIIGPASEMVSDAIDFGGSSPDESRAGLASLKRHGYYVRIARAAAKPRKLGPKDRLNVLVVEDDPQLAKLLKMYLQMENMVTTVAGNRDEILAALRKPPKPDLILLDVVLPDVDGFEVLTKIREFEALKTVPVILCTGKASREAVLNGLRRGADGYITKPYNVDVVLKAAKTVLGIA